MIKAFAAPLLIALSFFLISGPLMAARPEIYIQKTEVPNKVEVSGFSLAEMLGHPKAIFKTEELCANVLNYKQITDQIGKSLEVKDDT